MKHIRKGSEPSEFSDWKAQENDDWKPKYAYLRGDLKRIVKTALMREQGFLCCYCEQRLRENDSHIEHLLPQHPPDGSTNDSLDYSHLLCSCKANTKRHEPLHCGKARGNKPILSPLDPLCETRFSYNHYGEIFASDEIDSDAKATIGILNLNAAVLIALRSEVISPFLDSGLTPEDLARFVEGYLQLDSSGQLSPFFTTIRSLFRAVS